MQYAYANASRQDSSPVDSSPEVKAKRSYALLYLTSIPTMGSVVLMIASAGNAFHAWWKNRKNTTDKERLAIINVIAKNNPDLSLTNNKGVNAIQLTQDYLLSSYEDAYLAQALAEILELISPSAVREAELVSYATQESAPVQTTEVAEAIIVSAPEAD
jgi:hypothetical protein